jgi:NADPH:quinone reductase-like Zn-dependent oxidoreductase
MKGTMDLRKLMGKRALLRGTVLRARPVEEKIHLAREFERTIVPLFERGLLRPVVDEVFPAAEAAEAHRRMEANESFGKLLLDWDER